MDFPAVLVRGQARWDARPARSCAAASLGDRLTASSSGSSCYPPGTAWLYSATGIAFTRRRVSGSHAAVIGPHRHRCGTGRVAGLRPRHASRPGRGLRVGPDSRVCGGRPERSSGDAAGFDRDRRADAMTARSRRAWPSARCFSSPRSAMPLFGLLVHPAAVDGAMRWRSAVAVGWYLLGVAGEFAATGSWPTDWLRLTAPLLRRRHVAERRQDDCPAGLADRPRRAVGHRVRRCGRGGRRWPLPATSALTDRGSRRGRLSHRRRGRARTPCNTKACMILPILALGGRRHGPGNRGAVAYPAAGRCLPGRAALRGDSAGRIQCPGAGHFRGHGDLDYRLATAGCHSRRIDGPPGRFPGERTGVGRLARLACRAPRRQGQWAARASAAAGTGATSVPRR